MKVFISHSEKDEVIAGKVAATLRKLGLEVLPSTDLAPGENFALKMGQALTESEAMVVLLTPAALDSTWVRHEIEYALTEKAFDKKLIPVMVGSPEDLPFERVPWILRHMRMIFLPEHGDDEAALGDIAQALKEVVQPTA
ncbi:MAG TPA: toll/interleukin-1 receptor domain-containing protein [Blastocatellia bacterium]|nr:toll/interleukin-1 receptor domain-containing protein [Blastocatellia bacterium]